MAAYLAPIGNGQQFFTNQGVVLSGGQLFTYQAGTTTLQATYTDSTQVTPNANPIVLDSTGRSTNEIWLIGGSTYKFVLEDSNNNVIGTWDNLSGINDITGAVTQSEWITSSLTPSYVSATQFTLPGNQTSTFLVNRRLKIQVSSGLVYGYISASSFASSTTTITVVLDSGNLDSGISQVSYSLLSPTNVSIPSVINWTSAVTIASSSTVNIGAANSNVIIISGTTTITAFDNIAAGAMRWVRFSGALTLTYNATSMLLPGSANITTATNDEAVFVSLGSGNWKCISYTKYSGVPLVVSLTSPVAITSATLTAPAVAGNLENNGQVLAFTPTSTQRGLIPTEQYFRLDSGLAGANVNTAQSIFGVGVTLAASTVYEFEGSFILTKSAGVTSHNISLGFAGTATLNNIAYDAQALWVSGAIPGTTNNSLYGALTNSASAVTIITSIGQAADSIGVLIKGTVSINASGTLIPQYTLSAAPGGAYTTVGGSFFKIRPIGASGANVSIGTWA